MSVTRERILLQAAWIVPVDQPPIPEGAVVFAGDSIVAVGPAAAVRAAYSDATAKDLGNVAVLPGLVNAHVHLELTHARRPEYRGDFVDWLLEVINQQTATDVSIFSAEGTRAGVAQCLRFGVSSVGDISREVGVTRPLLQDGPLRAVSYGEVQAMAGRRTFLTDRLALASSTTHATNRHLRIGVSPHAPYSIEPDGIRACLDAARRNDFPIAMHLAETEEEAIFLSHHEGMFRRLWERINAWDDRVPTFAGGPIRLAGELGLLDYPTLLAHVNYCDDEELALLSAGRASVVYCPRTHAYFRHPPHRWREMLAAGVNVAVGTDSCVSSPDLNLVDDLRLLHAIAPEVPPMQIWALATIRAARAIGEDQRVGTITPGKFADLAVFPVDGPDPMVAILQSDVLPSQTWIGGMLVRGN